VNDVTIVIPSIPPRRLTLLPVALESVWKQEYPISAVSVAMDVHRQGAWATRQRALDAASTRWVQYLDDDDELYPQHVRLLMDCALENQADFVYSYWDLKRTPDLLGHFGKPFDPENPQHTTMTVLVKTELAKSVGFTPREPEHEVGGEDWRFLLGCVEAKAKIVHLPEQTWHWRWHSANSSGREDRW
jgi:hypothetical protein